MIKEMEIIIKFDVEEIIYIFIFWRWKNIENNSNRFELFEDSK